MKTNLDTDIESLPVSKLFEYFQYIQTFASAQYNIYTKKDSLFYVFLNSHEQHQIYFRNELSLVSKKQCLLLLSQAHSVSEIANLVTLIARIEANKNNSNLSVTSSANVYLKLSLNLSPLPIAPGAWYTLPIFDKRIHFSPTDKYVIPLCEYKGKEAVRYNNFVEWKQDQYSFLNESTSGLITSIPTASITRLFLACHPYSWELFAPHSTSLDHFFVLVHPNAYDDTLSQVQMFHNDMHLSGYTLPHFSDERVKEFNVNFIRFQTELNHPYIFSLELNYKYGVLRYQFKTPSDHAMKIWKLINDINFRIEDAFNTGIQQYFFSDENAYSLLSLEKLDSTNMTVLKGKIDIHSNFLGFIMLWIETFNLNISVHEFEGDT